MSATKFSKLYIALKFRLLGANYTRALVALETARKIHKDFRKDGETPEFQHQIEIALHLMTVKGIDSILEDVIICALLHDTPEDYPEALPPSWYIQNFGEDNWRRAQWLNKNLWKDYPTYFGQLATDPVTALVKGCDRKNNFQSMNRGKFSIEKQKKYAEEVQVYFLPMLKEARRLHPVFMDAFYSLESILKDQHELITLFIKASEK
jgi:(p)ppGpp synthase/HD superfamily hydrolase